MFLVTFLRIVRIIFIPALSVFKYIECMFVFFRIGVISVPYFELMGVFSTRA